jgi:hypothetical protein
LALKVKAISVSPFSPNVIASDSSVMAVDPSMLTVGAVT